jgi:hypothetical protein
VGRGESAGGLERLLPELLWKKIRDVQAVPEGDLAKFMARMAQYFDGDFQRTVAHYEKVHIRNLSGEQIIIHDDAFEALRRVDQTLRSENLSLPRVTDSYSHRGSYKGPRHGPGMMMHILGLAVDFDAKNNPQIKDPRLVALQVAVVGDPNAYHLNLPRTPTTSGTAPSITQTTVGAEHGRLQGASHAFQASIPPEDRMELLALRTQYFILWQQYQEENRQVATLQKKKQDKTTMVEESDVEGYTTLKRGDATPYDRAVNAEARTASEIRAVLLRTSSLLKPWQDAVARERTREEGKAANTADKGEGPQRLQALADLQVSLVYSGNPEEFGRFVFGRSKPTGKKGRTRGNANRRTGEPEPRPSIPEPVREVSNPPLLQLLEFGYYNLEKRFVEEMARNGFRVGAAWSAGWVDAMHFDYKAVKVTDPSRSLQR